MQITLRKDMRHQYLVISSEGRTCTDYRAKMIFNNRIEGFASCFSERLDSDELFYYEIPFGYTGLNSFLEANRTDAKLFKVLFSTLADAIKNAGEYLLDEDGIVLDTAGILISVETNDIIFVYFPGQNSSFDENCLRLSERLLHNLDHNDHTAVERGYDFYRKCSGGKICSELLKEMALSEKYEDANRRTGGYHEYKVTDEKEEALMIKENEDEHDFSFLFEEEDKKAPKRRERKKRRFGFRKSRKQEETQIKETSEAFGKTDTEDKIKRDFKKELRTGSMQTVLLRKTVRKNEEAFLTITRAEGEERILLKKDTCLIGKAVAGADIEIDETGISRIHARLSENDGVYSITDLGSRNGSYINGVRLEPGVPVELENGDEIQLADTIMIIST